MSSSAITGPLLSDVSRSADGSAAAPSWSFQNSPTMGFYRVSANVLGLSTAGVQRMVVDASGNVGIGTGSPTGKLHINAGSVSSDTYIERLSWSDSSGTNKGLLSFYSNSGADIRGFIGADNNGVLYLGDNGGGGVRFLTGGPSGTERMRIDSSGNLLVGTTSGIKRANFAGNNVDLVYTETTSNVSWSVGPISTGTGRFNWYNATATLDRMYLTPAGALFNTTGTYGTISDVSLKENIVDATPKLADVLQIRVRNYNMKADPDKKKVIGVVAQELEEVFPGLIEETVNRVACDDGTFEENTVKAVKYSVLTTILVKAIQELSAKVDAQAAEGAALRSEIEALKAK
jgi:hypothetical protein